MLLFAASPIPIVSFSSRSQTDSCRLPSQTGKLVLEKRLEQWESINNLLFSQAETQWFKAPFIPQRKSDHAFVTKGRRLHLVSIIHLWLEAESQDVLERCWLWRSWPTSIDSHTIGRATNFTQTRKKKKNEFWNCHLAMLGRVAKPI